MRNRLLHPNPPNTRPHNSDSLSSLTLSKSWRLKLISEGALVSSSSVGAMKEGLLSFAKVIKSLVKLWQLKLISEGGLGSSCTFDVKSLVVLESFLRPSSSLWRRNISLSLTLPYFSGINVFSSSTSSLLSWFLSNNANCSLVPPARRNSASSMYPSPSSSILLRSFESLADSMTVSIFQRSGAAIKCMCMIKSPRLSTINNTVATACNTANGDHERIVRPGKT